MQRSEQGLFDALEVELKKATQPDYMRDALKGFKL